MRRNILIIASIIAVATAAHAYTTGDWKCVSGACTIGAASITGVTTITDGASLNVEGTTTNTLTLTAAGANAAVFEGADASTPANAQFTTTGIGTVTLGDASATAVIWTTDGASLNLEGTTTESLTLAATAANAAVFRGADAASPANTLFTTTSTGAITIGHGTALATNFVTDGGTATFDGFVTGPKPIVAIASTPTTLTANSVHIISVAGDYTLPACGSATMDWVTVVQRDASEVVKVLPDSGSTIAVPGTTTVIEADHELDSPGAADGAGDFVTLICSATNKWYGTSLGGAWTDGGAG